MKTEHLKLKTLALAFFCLLPSAFCLGQTPVLFPLNQMFGGNPYVESFTAQAAQTFITSGTNAWIGSSYSITPTGGTNPIVMMTPNTYLITFPDATYPWRIKVPNTTNLQNALSLSTGPLPTFLLTPGVTFDAAGAASNAAAALGNTTAATFTNAANSFTGTGPGLTMLEASNIVNATWFNNTPEAVIYPGNIVAYNGQTNIYPNSLSCGVLELWNVVTKSTNYGPTLQGLTLRFPDSYYQFQTNVNLVISNPFSLRIEGGSLKSTALVYTGTNTGIKFWNFTGTNVNPVSWTASPKLWHIGMDNIEFTATNNTTNILTYVDNYVSTFYAEHCIWTGWQILTNQSSGDVLSIFITNSLAPQGCVGLVFNSTQEHQVFLQEDYYMGLAVGLDGRADHITGVSLKSAYCGVTVTNGISSVGTLWPATSPYSLGAFILRQRGLEGEWFNCHSWECGLGFGLIRQPTFLAASTHDLLDHFDFENTISYIAADSYNPPTLRDCIDAHSSQLTSTRILELSDPTPGCTWSNISGVYVVSNITNPYGVSYGADALTSPSGFAFQVTLGGQVKIGVSSTNIVFGGALVGNAINLTNLPGILSSNTYQYATNTVEILVSGAGAGVVNDSYLGDIVLNGNLMGTTNSAIISDEQILTNKNYELDDPTFATNLYYATNLAGPWYSSIPGYNPPPTVTPVFVVTNTLTTNFIGGNNSVILNVNSNGISGQINSGQIFGLPAPNLSLTNAPGGILTNTAGGIVVTNAGNSIAITTNAIVTTGPTVMITTNVSWWTGSRTWSGMPNQGGSGFTQNGSTVAIINGNDTAGVFSIYNGTTGNLVAKTNIATLIFAANHPAPPKAVQLTLVEQSNLVNGFEIYLTPAAVTTSNLLIFSTTTAFPTGCEEWWAYHIDW